MTERADGLSDWRKQEGGIEISQPRKLKSSKGYKIISSVKIFFEFFIFLDFTVFFLFLVCFKKFYCFSSNIYIPRFERGRIIRMDHVTTSMKLGREMVKQADERANLRRRRTKKWGGKTEWVHGRTDPAPTACRIHKYVIFRVMPFFAS